MVNKYEKMSNFEVNQRIAKIKLSEQDVEYLKQKPICCIPEFGMSDICSIITPMGDVHEFDFCSNPSDIMPLVFELKMSLEFIDGFGWTASCGSKEFSCYDRPLRAAAIVYLMIMEGEHGK